LKRGEIFFSSLEARFKCAILRRKSFDEQFLLIFFKIKSRAGNKNSRGFLLILHFRRDYFGANL